MAVDSRLEGRFGPAPPRPARDPLSELVVTILSQNTSDLNTQRAETSLRSAFPRWEDVLAAPVEVIEAAIRVGGLSNLKAPRIQSVLAEVKRREGSLTLSRLAALPLPEVLGYLESIPGIGPKTAACVALFALGKPAFPVDTHVHRVAGRLGLIKPTDDAAAAHRRLAEAVPPGRRYAFHVHLIELGRAICQARRPQCEACPLTRECDYFRRER
ncbi:MAG: endonuclease III [Candidatus Dormibacteraceae bacterium]